MDKVQKLIEEWNRKKDNYLDEWYGPNREHVNGLWPAKLVETRFVFEGENYTIKPETIGLNGSDPWDQGFLEYLQKYISKDLEEIGATDICNLGFLD